MKRVELDSLDAPARFGTRTLVPTADELGRLAASADLLVIGGGQVGYDAVGVDLVERYERLRAQVARRLRYDGALADVVAETLEDLSASYRRLVDCNSASGAER